MKSVVEDFELLLEKGNTGFYNSAEITNIYVIKDGIVLNFFTLVVLEENTTISKRKFLTPKLIKINEVSMGISQERISVNKLKNVFLNLIYKNEWKVNENDFLKVNKLKPMQKYFVPDLMDIPLNNILKNNKCSYVIEFFSENKNNLIFDNKTYRKLCDKLMDYLPIDLIYLNDRIGNVLFQFPVTLLSVNTRAISNTNTKPTNVVVNTETLNVATIKILLPKAYTQMLVLASELSSKNVEAVDDDLRQRLSLKDKIEIKIGWHPLLTVFPNLEVFVTINYDDIIIGSASYFGKIKDKINLVCDNTNGEITTSIQNKENGLLLWHNDHTFQEFHFNSGIMGSEPRIVNIDDESYFIQLRHCEEMYRGLMNHPYIKLIDKRKYEESTRKLIENKSFLQYGHKGLKRKKEALEDLKEIIEKHGQHGVFLWDPYAYADEILKTVYFSPCTNKQIRVINSYSKKRIKIPKSNNSSSNDIYSVKKSFKIFLNSVFYLFKFIFSEKKDLKFDDWKSNQIKILKSKSNNIGLKLEIRTQIGKKGWDFHDRFLIFPGSDLSKPKVWSLGTSINSMGQSHSIMMSVNNPQNILDEFNELWAELEDSVLWKYPEI